MDGPTQRMAPMMGGHISASRMSEQPEAESAPAAGWEVERVEFRKAENGGAILSVSRCRRRPKGKPSNSGLEPDKEYDSKDYAFGDVASALAFVGEQMGSPAATEPDADDEMA